MVGWMYELFTAVFALLFTFPCLHFPFSKTHPAMALISGTVLIHGRHSERHLLVFFFFFFGSSVVLYDSEFRACWRWKDL